MDSWLTGLPRLQSPQTVRAKVLEVAHFHAGSADGNLPATDGSAQAGRFTGPRTHRQVPDAGHNLPREAPHAFASAVLKLAGLRAQEAKE
jgi:hypothetical protein